MPKIRRQLGGEVDVFSDQRPEQTLHVGNNGVDIHHFEFEQLLAAEGQQLPRQGGRAISSLLDGLYFRQQRIALVEIFEQHLGVTADDHQKIIEVVRHAACQPSDGLHFLRLTKLVFQSAPFGDILGDDFERCIAVIHGIG